MVFSLGKRNGDTIGVMSYRTWPTIGSFLVFSLGKRNVDTIGVMSYLANNWELFGLQSR